MGSKVSAFSLPGVYSHSPGLRYSCALLNAERAGVRSQPGALGLTEVGANGNTLRSGGCVSYLARVLCPGAWLHSCTISRLAAGRGKAARNQGEPRNLSLGVAAAVFFLQKQPALTTRQSGLSACKCVCLYLTSSGVGQPLLCAPTGDPLLQRVKESLRDVEHQRLGLACCGREQEDVG